MNSAGIHKRHSKKVHTGRMDAKLEDILQDALRDLDDDEGSVAPKPPPPPTQTSTKAKAQKAMAFDPLAVNGPRRRAKPQKKASSASGVSEPIRPDVNELCNSLTGLLEDLVACDTPAGDPTSTGSSGGYDLKATLDALESASRQAVEGHAQQAQPLHEKESESALVEAVMQKLLSKEMLYEPLMEIKEQYPSWFESKAGIMSEAELQPYLRQHDFIKEICGVYETDADNYEELIRLFQEVQACGQPPTEIVSAVAPEIGAFDSNPPQGMPGIGPQDCLQQ